MTGGRGAGFRFQRVSSFRFQEVSSFRGRGESNAGVRALLV